jgi:Polysaccharide lyase
MIRVSRVLAPHLKSLEVLLCSVSLACSEGAESQVEPGRTAAVAGGAGWHGDDAAGGRVESGGTGASTAGSSDAAGSPTQVGGGGGGGRGSQSDAGTGGTAGTPGGGAGEVLWHADPNRSLTSQFYALSKQDELDCDTPPPSEESSATTFIDPTYGQSWRVEKAQYRKRAELSRTNGLSFAIGQTYFIGWRARFNVRPDQGAGLAVMQWKSEGEPNLQNYPFNLEYDGTTLSLNAFTPNPATASYSQGSRRATVWKAKVAQNTWQDLVLKVRVSDKATQGTLELWHNGMPQVFTCDDTASGSVCAMNGAQQLILRTFDGDNVYLKWGAYGKAACVSQVDVDLNNLKVGTSYEAARP